MQLRGPHTHKAGPGARLSTPTLAPILSLNCITTQEVCVFIQALQMRTLKVREVFHSVRLSELRFPARGPNAFHQPSHTECSAICKVSKTFNIIPELLVLQRSGHQSGKSPKHAIPVLFMLCSQILPDKY